MIIVACEGLKILHMYYGFVADAKPEEQVSSFSIEYNSKKNLKKTETRMLLKFTLHYWKLCNLKTWSFEVDTIQE